MNKFIVVFTTVSSRKDARRIADHLVKNKIAACVNIVSGIRSTYVWKKKLYRTPELLLIIKTTKGKWSALKRSVKKIHPYEVPELIAIPIIAGSRDYLAWISLSLSPHLQIGQFGSF